MAHRSSGLALLLVSASALACGSVAPRPEAEHSAPSTSSSDDTWEVRGVLADACQCRVFCPCEFNSNPSEGRCDDAAILAIEKGRFGNVHVDGLSIVVVSQSPQGERMVDNVGKLTFARLYVGKQPTAEQAQALAELARRILGTFVKNAARISPDETVQRVDLDASASTQGGQARIPGILDLAIETQSGGDHATPIVIKNSPWSVPGVGDVLVGHSTRYTYTAEGRSWEYAGRSASLRTLQMQDSITPPK